MNKSEIDQRFIKQTIDHHLRMNTRLFLQNVAILFRHFTASLTSITPSHDANDDDGASASKHRRLN
jgi:hypothetical protein